MTTAGRTTEQILSAVRADLGEPSEIVTLELGRKSHVTELCLDGRRVVVKSADATTLTAEHHLYDQVLPALGIAAPAVHRWQVDASGGLLVMDRVPGRPVELADPVDRRALTTWVAVLHTAWWTIDVDTCGLPRRRPQASADTLARLEAVLRGKDRTGRRDEALRRCTAVAEGLPAVWAACAEAPATLCHGDLSPENVLVDGDRVVAVDWEKAAITSPATDMGSVDAVVYREVVTARGIHLTTAVAERMRLAGKVLADLSHDLPRKSLHRQLKYLKRMQRTVEALQAVPGR